MIPQRTHDNEITCCDCFYIQFWSLRKYSCPYVKQSYPLCLYFLGNRHHSVSHNADGRITGHGDYYSLHRVVEVHTGIPASGPYSSSSRSHENQTVRRVNKASTPGAGGSRKGNSNMASLGQSHLNPQLWFYLLEILICGTTHLGLLAQKLQLYKWKVLKWPPPSAGGIW